MKRGIFTHTALALCLGFGAAASAADEHPGVVDFDGGFISLSAGYEMRQADDWDYGINATLSAPGLVHDNEVIGPAGSLTLGFLIDAGGAHEARSRLTMQLNGFWGQDEEEIGTTGNFIYPLVDRFGVTGGVTIAGPHQHRIETEMGNLGLDVTGWSDHHLDPALTFSPFISLDLGYRMQDRSMTSLAGGSLVNDTEEELEALSADLVLGGRFSLELAEGYSLFAQGEGGLTYEYAFLDAEQFLDGSVPFDNLNLSQQEDEDEFGYRLGLALGLERHLGGATLGISGGIDYRSDIFESDHVSSLAEIANTERALLLGTSSLVTYQGQVYLRVPF